MKATLLLIENDAKHIKAVKKIKRETNQEVAQLFSDDFIKYKHKKKTYGILLKRIKVLDNLLKLY